MTSTQNTAGLILHHAYTNIYPFVYKTSFFSLCIQVLGRKKKKMYS